MEKETSDKKRAVVGKDFTSAALLRSGTTFSFVHEVDALRALAVTVVIVFHSELFHVGWSGVWLFFVISGFAITTSLLNSDAHRPSRAILIRNFYIRRSLRIWPLYFGYVVIATLALIYVGLLPPLSDLPWILTFTQNFRQIFRDSASGTYWIGFGILWTLAVEEQFYLVFPMLFAFLSRRTLIWVLVALICAAPFVRYGVGAWAHSKGWTTDEVGRAIYAFMPAQMDSFGVGCLIALLRPYLQGNRNVGRIVLACTLAIAILYVGYYALLDLKAFGPSMEAVRQLFRHHNYGAGREMWVYTIIVAVSGTLILLILTGENPLAWITRRPLVQYIGRISYGAYMFHGIVIWALTAYLDFFGGGGQDMSRVQRIVLFLSAYPIILLLAHFSFKYYERPFLTLRKRFD